MFEKISTEAILCLKTLESNGYEAYIVGGAVRDILMGLEPQDFDITTNAKPQEIMDIFEKTIPTGIDHGTVTVVLNNKSIEVTTYRNDGKYSDHRSPERVSFVSDIDDDLSRRDFTVNAICYNPKTDIYDVFGGINDLNNKIIRAIGNPLLRYNEDALRILRAFRFSAQLDFSLEEKTFNDALTSANLLKEISKERIFVELKKTFISKKATALNPLIISGGLDFLGFNKKEIPEEAENLPNNFALRFAFYAKSMQLDAANILNNLKSDRKTISNTQEFINLLSSPIKTKADIKKMLNKSDEQNVKLFIECFYKDKVSVFNEIINSNEPYKLSMLNINGIDIEKLGFKGKKIGEILDAALIFAIDNPKKSDKENLIDFTTKTFM